MIYISSPLLYQEFNCLIAVRAYCIVKGSLTVFVFLVCVSSIDLDKALYNIDMTLSGGIKEG